MLSFKEFSESNLEENNSSSHVPVHEIPPPVLTLKRISISHLSSGPKTIVLYECEKLKKYFTVLVG